MAIELKVPTVGESITEVQIGQWRKGEGASALKDENLVEIETDKATVELSAPVTGTISRVLKQRGETALVGEVIGYMEESAVDPAHAAAAAAAQAQAADMIRTPAKRAAESPKAAKPAAGKTDAGKTDARSDGRSAAPAPPAERGLVVSPDARSGESARPAAKTAVALPLTSGPRGGARKRRCR